MKGLTLSEPMVKAWMEGRKTITRRLMNPLRQMQEKTKSGFNIFNLKEIKPPYRPGETVYIKETWGIASRRGCLVDPCLNYKADGKQVCIEPKVLIDNNYKHRDGWRSPRFMPEWAARSRALIKSVRPERVQEITVEEAIKEGIDDCCGYYCNESVGHVDHQNTINRFSFLWESLHPGSWERNDWVWRIELKLGC